jgi:hypothetical protein
MFRLIFLFFLFLPAGDFAAQALIRTAGDLRDLPLQFNPDTIRARKIRTAIASIVYKPDNQIIQDKGLMESYDFDSLGRPWRYARTRVKAYSQVDIPHPAVYRRGRRVAREWTETKFAYVYDTIFVHFYYDSLNRLSIRRMSDGDYYNTWYYTYNADGMISLQSQFRETNLNNNPHEFKLGMQTMISMEEFRYMRISPTQIKQLCLNDEGKVYKESISDYDAHNRLIAVNQSFVVSWIRLNDEYTYDSLGRMTAHTWRSNAGDEVEQRDEYHYDSLGNMYQTQQYKNGKLIQEASLLYDPIAQPLYAITNRRFNEGIFDIIKFRYIHFGEEEEKKKGH